MSEIVDQIQYLVFSKVANVVYQIPWQVRLKDLDVVVKSVVIQILESKFLLKLAWELPHHQPSISALLGQYSLRTND